MTTRTEKLAPHRTFIIEVREDGKSKVNIYGDKLHSLIDDLGWDYQCLTRSGKETYDEIMTMFGVLEEGETWLEED